MRAIKYKFIQWIQKKQILVRRDKVEVRGRAYSNVRGRTYRNVSAMKKEL